MIAVRRNPDLGCSKVIRYKHFFFSLVGIRTKHARTSSRVGRRASERSVSGAADEEPVSADHRRQGEARQNHPGGLHQLAGIVWSVLAAGGLSQFDQWPCLIRFHVDGLVQERYGEWRGERETEEVGGRRSSTDGGAHVSRTHHISQNQTLYRLGISVHTPYILSYRRLI